MKDQQLIPVVTQDYFTKDVLMMAYMNKEALGKTLESGQAHYYSRSRKKLWRKGESSGHTQELKEIHFDCDRDTLLMKVEQVGPACHTGHKSCFFEELHDVEDVKLSGGPSSFPDALLTVCQVIEERKNTASEGSYVSTLLNSGIDRILKKVAEEAGEVLIACKNDDRAETIHELTDLWFHILVLMSKIDVSLDEIGQEFKRREKNR